MPSNSGYMSCFINSLQKRWEKEIEQAENYKNCKNRDRKVWFKKRNCSCCQTQCRKDKKIDIYDMDIEWYVPVEDDDNGES